MKPSRILIACVLASVCLLSDLALAKKGINNFCSGITPNAGLYFITPGPDGNLWFTEQIAHRIGRITLPGVVTEFSSGITVGAGSKHHGGPRWQPVVHGMAATGSGGLPRSASSPSSAPASPPAPNPTHITAGPDGNLWFTEYGHDRIGRITTTGVVTEFSAGITAGAHPMASRPAPMATCGSRNWRRSDRADHPGRRRHRVQRRHHRRREPHGITAGPDGNLWFTEYRDRSGGSPRRGRHRVQRRHHRPKRGPRITAGPDGNLWFTETNGNRIARITPRGRSRNSTRASSRPTVTAPITSRQPPTARCGSRKMASTASGKQRFK